MDQSVAGFVSDWGIWTWKKSWISYGKRVDWKRIPYWETRTWAIFLGRTEMSDGHYFPCCLVLSIYLFNTPPPYEIFSKIPYCLQSTVKFKRVWEGWVNGLRPPSKWTQGKNWIGQPYLDCIYIILYFCKIPCFQSMET